MNWRRGYYFAVMVCFLVGWGFAEAVADSSIVGIVAMLIVFLSVTLGTAQDFARWFDAEE